VLLGSLSDCSTPATHSVPNAFPCIRASILTVYGGLLVPAGQFQISIYACCYNSQGFRIPVVQLLCLKQSYMLALCIVTVRTVRGLCSTLSHWEAADLQVHVNSPLRFGCVLHLMHAWSACRSWSQLCCLLLCFQQKRQIQVGCNRLLAVGHSMTATIVQFFRSCLDVSRIMR
jgi:hypothetical protein